ncbi:MAG: heme exporter protein CcmD [Deltaproteobacteria bacterium]|mgnify:FL=1|jgi:heme exporter protein D|nr:heme exporter protein CcmD [Gammaproteobacteria bacterium]MBP78682.1 heme exporter protein CcmD [Deltaproteobacteria bacterium]
MLSTVQFSSFADFINMGGYAFNVWAVYGLFAVFLVVNLWFPLLKRKKIIRNLKRARQRQSQDQR